MWQLTVLPILETNVLPLCLFWKWV